MKMYQIPLLGAIIILFLASSCQVKKAINTSVSDVEKTLILVSFDGYRHDYPEAAETPALDRMEKKGIRAEGLKTVFPSKTFPNHISIVTGLYPEHHGIIANTIYDAKSDDWYKLGNGAPAQSKWYNGEPIWITAERQGVKAATFFWPSSVAEIKGHRPSYWHKYDGKIPYDKRVDQVLKWLDLPKAERPQFISLYFDEPDHSGHVYGPLTPETKAACEDVDKQLNTLIVGIESRNLLDKVNIIVISDHGMTPLSEDSLIFLDDYINLDDVKMIDWSPVGAMRPLPGKEDAVYTALKNAHPKMKVFRKGDLPEKYHYNHHEFIQPIVLVADLGWTITSRGYFERKPNSVSGGTHGYDSGYRDMDGIFYAMGPDFKKGQRVPAFQNIHIYHLMCRLLDIKPAQNDGNPTKLLHLLK